MHLIAVIVADPIFLILSCIYVLSDLHSSMRKDSLGVFYIAASCLLISMSGKIFQYFESVFLTFFSRPQG